MLRHSETSFINSFTLSILAQWEHQQAVQFAVDDSSEGKQTIEDLREVALDGGDHLFLCKEGVLLDVTKDNSFHSGLYILLADFNETLTMYPDQDF